MIFVTGQTMSSPAFQFMWPSVILRFNLQLCFSFINFNITFINFHSSLYQSLFFSAHTHTHTHIYIYIYEITSWNLLVIWTILTFVCPCLIIIEIISGDEKDTLLPSRYKCHFTRCCSLRVAIQYHTWETICCTWFEG